MKLPQRELLAGARQPEALAALLRQAETVLRTWEPQWTGFLAAEVREEAEQRLEALSELELRADGGYPAAERRCLLLQRREAPLEPEAFPAPLIGLDLSGNFLFDPSSAAAMAADLLAAAGGSPEQLGDLWLRGDRGGQAILRTDLAARLEGQEIHVGPVPVLCQTRPIESLQLPAQRQERRLQTVEASLRLDAVASAGFGVSRNRMAELIRQGAMRLNWQPLSSPSRLLAAGDRLQLAGRGELLIESIQPTKRDRWRIELLRR
ncbi:MAG: photosystem II S4 domain protein [Prochlorococcaceae cyanobacterium]